MSARHTSQRFVTVAWLPLLLATQACEGDAAPAPELPPARPAEVAAAQMAATPPPGEASSTNLVTEIDRHPFAATSRDPFTPPPRASRVRPEPETRW